MSGTCNRIQEFLKKHRGRGVTVVEELEEVARNAQTNPVASGLDPGDSSTANALGEQMRQQLTVVSEVAVKSRSLKGTL